MKKEPLGNSAATRVANVINAKILDSIKEEHRGMRSNPGSKKWLERKLDSLREPCHNVPQRTAIMASKNPSSFFKLADYECHLA